MSRRWTLTKESFDSLLAWLDPDREQSARKYESIRRTLIKIFTWRNVSDAEDLADETINRVAQRVNEVKPYYSGDPALYFYGVAKNLLKEQARSRRLQVGLEEENLRYMLAPNDRTAIDLEYECLSKCLDDLSKSNRELIVKYYAKEKQRKIDYRRALAQRLHVAPNVLRVRAHRIRAALESCVEKCIDAQGLSD
jgi:RNA polymerase sigma factor (sigma-70 family)